MIERSFPILNKSFMVWLGLLTGIGMLFGCGGGSGNGASGAINTAGNHTPTALISSPSGTYFKEGENIAFSATATDAEDGQLSGSALVWISSKDGPIGTGATLVTSALSAGDHDITLAATDSDGATGTETLPTISVAQTRFIKMGPQTTGVPDASNAFDGDQDTAATIMTPDTEFIHFKAYLGGADTFFFKIKLGASTPGSRLAIHGLTANATWQPVSDIDLGLDNTVPIKVTNAQNYKDTNGYINLRARWEGGANGDNVSIFEIWRTDKAYAGPKTIGVIDPDAAFDGDTSMSSSSVIEHFWGEGNIFESLHIKAYVGRSEDSVTFNMLINSIANDQFLFIDIETTPDNWIVGLNLPLNTTDTRSITIPNVQSYLDTDGYISLRARWVGFGTSNNLEIYEFWRVDPFIIGPKTSFDWIHDPIFAVDGDLVSFARIDYSWGEQSHNDYLHVQSFVGDEDTVRFSISTDSSTPGSVLIIDGEFEPDNWSPIAQINLDSAITTDIELPNARKFIDADGYINLRTRWEGGSPIDDALINEIWR